MIREKLAPESCHNICSILYAMGVGIVLSLFLLTCGCNTAKRLRRIDANHPLTSARFYAERYPIKESTEVRVDTVTSITYMPPEVHYIDCDSALKYRTDTGRLIIQVPCPPAQLITRMVTKDSIVRVENKAAIEAARLEAANIQSKYETCRTWRNYLWWAAGIGWFLIVGTIILRFIKPVWL